MIEINNFEELKEYILNNELSKLEISEILEKTLKIWINPEINKIDMVQMIEKFYSKYPILENRPLFLDI